MIELSDEQQAVVDEVVSGASQVVLCSGFAGSGKSVITRRLQDLIPNTIVACYSGIAANNIGGQTACSLFGIPTTFVIDPKYMDAKRVRSKDPYAKHFNRADKKSREPWEPVKHKVLRSASLLILDEVYSIRCDHIDFIDKTMRQAMKKPTLPFGGIRVFMTGDEGQSQAIAKPNEKVLLSEYGYASPFNFWEAKIFRGEDQMELEV